MGQETEPSKNEPNHNPVFAKNRTEPNPVKNQTEPKCRGSYSVLSLNEIVGTFTHFTRLKILFGYRRSDSVTDMLFTLNLPSFDTILHNGNQLFVEMVSHFNSNLADVLRRFVHHAS